MAKSVTDNSARKAQAKSGGGLKAAARQAARSPVARSSAAPRGTVSSKPRGRIRTFFREVRVELTKVTWPSRKELLTSTGVVIIAVVIASVFIAACDYIWNVIIRAVGLG